MFLMYFARVLTCWHNRSTSLTAIVVAIAMRRYTRTALDLLSNSAGLLPLVDAWEGCQATRMRDFC